MAAPKHAKAAPKLNKRIKPITRATVKSINASGRVGSKAGHASPTIKVGDLGNAPIIPLLLLFVGAYLAWFGVKYWRSDVRWPSDPVKSVLQGKGIPGKGVVQTSADILAEAQHHTSKKSSGSGVPVPAGAHGNVAKNQNTAKLLAAGYGWAPQQNRTDWNALVDLWNRESGWNQYAKNPTSGAYGIPQALPADKLATAGSGWKRSPKIQIKWGLAYIKARYGSPAGAWAHEEKYGWY